MDTTAMMLDSILAEPSRVAALHRASTLRHAARRVIAEAITAAEPDRRLIAAAEQSLEQLELIESVLTVTVCT